jgi:hypothetical protein
MEQTVPLSALSTEQKLAHHAHYTEFIGDINSRVYHFVVHITPDVPGEQTGQIVSMATSTNTGAELSLRKYGNDYFGAQLSRIFFQGGNVASGEGISLHNGTPDQGAGGWGQANDTPYTAGLHVF